ncbi:MAG TPA: translocation/assembly module TamB domain-containing protein [Holophagaceae bacterium]|nr:translocation/assembly module TamB domain-containing protein [Holophagaceae bacterium]
MMWHPTKDACKRLWGRRWARRLTYLIAAGVGAAVGGSWLLERPAVAQWAVSKADGWMRENTGLSLSLDRLELHPFFGTVSLDGLALGGDLLTIRHVEARFDPASLFIGTPRVYTLRIVDAHGRLSPDRVARIHLKPRPETDRKTPELLLDLLSISGARVEVLEPVWGLPKGELDFDLKGRGTGTNQLKVNLVAPQLKLQSPRGFEQGRLNLDADLSDHWMVLQDLRGELGKSRLTASGAFEPRAGHRFELKTDASMDLEQLFTWLRQREPLPFTGKLETQVQATGTIAQPRWTFRASGSGLKPGDARFAPGDLELRAAGTLKDATLEHLGWKSTQGRLEANGRWAAPRTFAHLDLKDWSLEPVAQAAHAAPLSGAKADVSADIQGPSDFQAMSNLMRWEATAKVALAQDGASAGGFNASLKNGHAVVPAFSVQLRGLQADGQGEGRLDSKGLAAFQAKGSASLDANEVAGALHGWKVVDLDMGGATDAQAQVSWDRATGLTLDGTVEAQQPRWHHAMADHLKASVEIRGDELAVKDIHLDKGKVAADAQLRLTWAKRHSGDDFDLTATFKDMPLAEGLKAADLDLPLTGLGSGDARLHGSYDHLVLLGHAQLADGRVYGIAVPAASTDYNLDITTLKLQVQDLRVADALDHLGAKDGKPSGDLALSGGGSLDLKALTADLRLAGAVDTGILQFPIPQTQGALDLHLDGPLASPFGGLELPEGSLSLKNSIVFFQDQSLVGLEADVERKGAKATVQIGFANRPDRAIIVDLGDRGATLFGHAALRLDEKTAPTQALAAQFSRGVLQDLRVDLGADGSYGANGLRWQGRLGQLSGDFGAFDLAQSRPAELRGTEKAATLSLELEGRQKGEGGAPTARATLAGTLPFSTREGMDLRSTGVMDLANFKIILDTLLDVDPYSALGETKPKGRGEYDLRAYGTYADPYADGQIRLADGSLSLGGYPSLNHLTFTMLAKGRELTLPKTDPLKATLAQGALTLDGTATWALGGIAKYDFNASLTGFQLRDLPGLDGAEAAGDLAVTLKGDDEGGMLRGRFNAERLSYQADIKLSDLILKSALSESGLSLLNPDDPLDRIGLDLDLHLSQPWVCDTNLLKLEGRPEGAFKVLGTLAHPGLKGRMDFLPGGRVTNLLPAGDVVIDRGYLNFTDPSSTDPYINLHGTVQVPGYQVELDVHGTLSNLDIVPTSTPSLRRDEIVAILIQPELASTIASSTPGSSQSALSSGLASASSGLVTTLALATLQEQVRRTFGLDRVSVSLRSGSGSGTEREIQLGKTFTLFDRRIPLLAFQRKSGELTTTGATVELRFGGVVLNFGVAQTAGEGIDPTGEIVHSWSPR